MEKKEWLVDGEWASAFPRADPRPLVERGGERPYPGLVPRLFCCAEDRQHGLGARLHVAVPYALEVWFY